MTILIIGNAHEEHASYIHDKVTARGHQAVYFDSMAFPGTTRMAYEPGFPMRGTFQPDPNGPKIPLEAIRAVYWRTFLGINTEPAGDDAFMKNILYREIQSAIGSMFRNLDALWVNSPQAIDLHYYKTHQLQLMQARGIRVPDTLIANDPEAVCAFYDRWQGQVIYKPVLGGAHTQTVKPEDLTPERLAELSSSPVQFQELVPGVDVRAYVVGGQLFAAEIRSQTLDFRDDPSAPIVPVTLPEAVQADCFTVAETLGLKLSGIDIRRTPDNDFVFIEGNPSPMFIHFERVTGYPISDALVDLLVQAVS
jgi:glutathione synthase/RimK-type ligase-like ATP-grasp enzyme